MVASFCHRGGGCVVLKTLGLPPNSFQLQARLGVGRGSDVPAVCVMSPPSHVNFILDADLDLPQGSETNTKIEKSKISQAVVMNTFNSSRSPSSRPARAIQRNPI